MTIYTSIIPRNYDDHDKFLSSYLCKNKYYYIYLQLCMNAKQRASSKKEAQRLYGYIESHHIIPRCFDKELEYKKYNFVYLTAREHFIAHKLLIRCTIGKFNILSKLAIAKFLQANSQQKRLLTSKDYEYIRKICSQSMSGENNPLFGTSGTVLGKVCINDGKRNKFIFPNEDLPENFVYGSHIKNSLVAITNGTLGRRIDKNEPIPTGWWLGSSTKNKPSRLKGRTFNRTDNRGQKISASSKGKKFITNGIDDKKINKNDSVPEGWRYGRTNGIGNLNSQKQK